MSGSARMQEPPAERRMCAVTRPDQTNNALSRARAEISCFFLDTRLGRKSRLSRRTFYGFDSVAESSECPNHSCRAALPGFLRHCRAAFFIAHAVMQDYPNQGTEAVRNDADVLLCPRRDTRRRYRISKIFPLSFRAAFAAC